MKIFYCICCLLLLSQPTHAAKKSFLRKSGDYLRAGVPLSGVIVSWMKNDQEGLVGLAEGVVVTQTLTEVTKTYTNKERPDGTNNISMPSGHMSAASSGAAYLGLRYGWQYGAPAWLAAGIVGYSRVDAKKHDTVDVLVAAALAPGVQYMITTQKFSAAAVPVIDESSVGLQVTGSF